MARRTLISISACAVFALVILGGTSVNAGWVWGANGWYWQADPAPVMPYSYNNPVAVNTATTVSGTPVWNPNTGQWNYNTENTVAYQSAFQPNANTVMPGTQAQYVNQGGQQGVAWTDMYGNPHFNGTVTQNTVNGTHTTHLFYQRAPSSNRGR